MNKKLNHLFIKLYIYLRFKGSIPLLIPWPMVFPIFGGGNLSCFIKFMTLFYNLSLGFLGNMPKDCLIYFLLIIGGKFSCVVVVLFINGTWLLFPQSLFPLKFISINITS
jgi:hypothetical protein